MPKGNPGIPKSAAHRAKIGAANRGRKHSTETRAKISLAKRGTPAWNKGVCKPDATKTSVHNWLRQTFPRTGECERCGAVVGTSRATGTQYSFNRHPEPHTRDRADYEELCRPCHITKDMALRAAAA